MKALRDRTGAGMMDCKRALTEAGGDVDKAIEILRLKRASGSRIAASASRPRARSRPTCTTTRKVGVIVEVDCETDFVARNDDFVGVRARGRLAHRGGGAALGEPRGRSRARRATPSCGSSSRRRPTSPRRFARRSPTGKLEKWYREVVLLDQAHVNADKHEGKTIGELQHQIAATTGENVVIRRFARFVVGE